MALPALAVGVLGLGPMAAEGADTTSWTGEVLTRVSMTHSAEGHAAHGAGTMPMRTDVLLDTGTERLRLDTAGLPDLAFVAGATVVVEGTRAGSTIDVAAVAPASGMRAQLAAPAAPTIAPGVRSVAVVMVTYADAPAPVRDDNAVRQAFFDGTTSVGEFYRSRASSASDTRHVPEPVSPARTRWVVSTV